MHKVGHENDAGALVDQKAVASILLDFLASKRGGFLVDTPTVEDAIVKKASFIEQRGKGF